MRTLKSAIKYNLKGLIGSIRAPFYKSQYDIKPGYQHRQEFYHFDAVKNGLGFQQEVYQIASQLAEKENIKRVVDVGCGAAEKLMKYFDADVTKMGVEIKTTLDYLKRTYPQYSWYDGESDSFDEISAELAICADVIEHVVNPSEYLEKIASIGDLKFLVISTPDRDILRGENDFGPPRNKTHMREWNGEEFKNFISNSGFTIISHMLTHYEQGTQMIICRPS